MFKDTKAKIFVQQSNKASALEKRLFTARLALLADMVATLLRPQFLRRATIEQFHHN